MSALVPLLFGSIKDKYQFVENTTIRKRVKKQLKNNKKQK